MDVVRWSGLDLFSNLRLIIPPQTSLPPQDHMLRNEGEEGRRNLAGKIFRGSGLLRYAEVEGGNKYMYEVRAINSCGKSNFSQAFTVSIPLVVDPNAKIDVSEELRKGHLWLECWDQRDERNFWFHTITGEGGGGT